MNRPQKSTQRTEGYVQTGGVALFQNCRALATLSAVSESQGGAIFTGFFIQKGGLGMGHVQGCCTFDSGGCKWERRGQAKTTKNILKENVF